jgi:hypothetical protein
MLLIDGVRYEEWKPSSEEEFEQTVIEHASEIFGDNTEYFNLKKRLESSFGKSRIPDGYVVDFNNPANWHIVEIELSNHPIDTHIREQVNDFITATQQIISSNRHKIVDEIFNAINSSHNLRDKIEDLIKSKEIHWFLTDLILYKAPCLTIIIEKKTDNLEDELKASLRYSPMNVLEFRTFGQPDKQNHAHVFKPLFYSSATSELEIEIKSSNIKNGHLRIPKSSRRFFPGYKIPFDLETDIGPFKTWVSYAHGAKVGDLEKGRVIRAKLRKWYKKHTTIKVGDKVIIKAIEPMKKYRLEIVK